MQASTQIMRFPLGILLALSTSLLLVLSFPKFDFEYLIWVAFIPLWLSVLYGGKRGVLFFAFLAGMGFFIGISPWVWDIMTWKAGLLGYGFLSLYFGLSALTVKLLYPKVKKFSLIVGPVWIVFEFIRSNLFFLALPTVLISHTQYQNLGLIQMLSWTGSYGLSLLIMTVNGALADAFIYFFSLSSKSEVLPQTGGKRPPWLDAVAISSLVVLIWIVGSFSLPRTIAGPPLTVSVIHGNIPQDKKWDTRYKEKIMRQYEQLSIDTMENHPQLIVWPETATPGYVLKDFSLYTRLGFLVRFLNTYLLLGSAEYPKFVSNKVKMKESGNTALLFSPDGRLYGKYLKTKLVPFAEYVPAKDIIPWPEFIVPQKKALFNIANKEINLLKCNDVQLGALICWEIVFPEFSRKFIQKGAQLLINISNEAWFRKGGIPTNVLAASVFRAVENRVNVVRATNFGISGFIDPYGRISGAISDSKEGPDFKGTSTQTVHLSPPGTFYTRFGDLVIYFSMAYLAFILLFLRFKK